MSSSQRVSEATCQEREALPGLPPVRPPACAPARLRARPPAKHSGVPPRAVQIVTALMPGCILFATLHGRIHSCWRWVRAGAGHARGPVVACLCRPWQPTRPLLPSADRPPEPQIFGNPGKTVEHYDIWGDNAVIIQMAKDQRIRNHIKVR